jgi:gamma-glutamylcyclotransferase (GGCT)/AIG2-like uncharacterized protein YtfP
MPWLFSYGTLQQENVQLKTFGRRLQGEPDELPGVRLDLLKIEDPEVVATSGKTHHPILRFDGNPANRIAGTVFQVSESELADADRYEVAAYRRVEVALASGKRASVYVDAASAPPSPPASGQLP